MGGKSTIASVFRHIADLADNAVPHLRRLAQDPEHEHLRDIAATSLDALGDAVASTGAMSPIPSCPVPLGLASLAIRGEREVTREEASRWATELDKWAGDVDRIGGVTD